MRISAPAPTAIYTYKLDDPLLDDVEFFAGALLDELLLCNLDPDPSVVSEVVDGVGVGVLVFADEVEFGADVGVGVDVGFFVLGAVVVGFTVVVVGFDPEFDPDELPEAFVDVGVLVVFVGVGVVLPDPDPEDAVYFEHFTGPDPKTLHDPIMLVSEHCTLLFTICMHTGHCCVARSHVEPVFSSMQY